MSKLVIGHLYKSSLNLYGDDGNVEVIAARCLRRGIPVEIIAVEIGDKLSVESLASINFLFMGGGPDSSQKSIYRDFLEERKSFMSDYVSSGKAGLFVCGSYQLMGNYYKASDGSELKGLGIFDLHTVNFGKGKPRCIGNVRALLNNNIRSDKVFEQQYCVDGLIVGFENHGGRTYLGEKSKPFAQVTYGHGNNSEDSSEGVHLNNCIGTYFHGPVLAKNPHLADYLIKKSLGVTDLEEVDDTLTIASYTASKKLR